MNTIDKKLIANGFDYSEHPLKHFAKTIQIGKVTVDITISRKEKFNEILVQIDDESAERYYNCLYNAIKSGHEDLPAPFDKFDSILRQLHNPMSGNAKEVGGVLISAPQATDEMLQGFVEDLEKFNAALKEVAEELYKN